MLGLIGLGLVGSALCERFVHAGWSLCGFDIDGSVLTRAEERGLVACSCPAEVAVRARRVVLSLPNSDVVDQVVAGADGMLGALQPDDVLIDTTTADPLATVDLARRLGAAGVRFIDATILGSSQQVREGQALVMAGGDAADIAACKTLFDAFARSSFHMGPNGKGAEAKLVVNLVLGLNRLVLAEGLLLGQRAGIDLGALLEVLKDGAAYSRVMDHKGQKMMDGEFAPQARLAQHAKDVQLIRALADRCGAPLPLSQVHAEILARGVDEGLGDWDNAAVIEILRRMIP